MIEIGIGNTCNSNCIMCTSLMPPPKHLKVLSKNDIFREIDSHEPSNEYAITGGEPTIRNDLFEIIEYIKKKSPFAWIKIVTNGRMFAYPDYAKKFASYKNCSIISEFHGSNEEIHDKITESKGSFLQTLKGIKNLMKLNVQISLRIVISKENINDLSEIAKFYVNEFNDVHDVTLFPIDLVGNAQKNKEKLFISYTDLKQPLEKALDVLSTGDFSLNVFHVPFCMIDKKYYKYIPKGLTVIEKRVEFIEYCRDCIYKDECPRVWKTYIKYFGGHELKPIMKKD